MERGNKVFHAFHKKIKDALGRRYSRAQCRIDLFKAIKNKTKQVHGVALPKQLDLILKVREIEFDVMCGVSKLVFKLARKWSKNNTAMTLSDFYNEGLMAVQNAIYGYTDPDIQFSTYVFPTIKNRFLNKINETRPFCPWSEQHKELFLRFQKTQQDLATKYCRRVSIDEAIRKMELSYEEAQTIQHMLIQVINQGDLQSHDDEFEVGIDTATQREYEPTFDAMSLVDVEMNDWERKVLTAWLSGQRGWQTEVAENTINPETGKTYSRAAPKIALDRVINRIKVKYDKDLRSIAA